MACTEMYPRIPWEIVTDPLETCHRSPGNLSWIPLELVTDPLGTCHGSLWNLSRIHWELVTDPLGTCHGSPGNLSRVPWELVTDPLESAEHAPGTTDLERQSLYIFIGLKNILKKFWRGKGNSYFIYAKPYCCPQN